MTDEPDIVERLRTPGDFEGDPYVEAIVEEAAALIESLRAENRRAWEAYQIAWQQAVENGEALTAFNAKVARLEDALREIRDLPGEINPSNYDHDDVCHLNAQFIEAYRIANDALDPQPKVEMNDGE